MLLSLSLSCTVYVLPLYSETLRLDGIAMVTIFSQAII